MFIAATSIAITCALASGLLVVFASDSTIEWKNFIVWKLGFGIMLLLNLKAIGPSMQCIESELQKQNKILLTQSMAQAELLKKIHENHTHIMEIRSRLVTLTKNTKRFHTQEFPYYSTYTGCFGPTQST